MGATRPSKDEIFNTAAELSDESQRRAYLAAACAGNFTLQCEIEDLLERDRLAGSFLETPPTDLDATLVETASELPGTQIGPYTLIQAIGQGGMGIVYLAEQSRPVRRQVALKIIKPGMDTRQVIHRFEVERQTLALMDHPNIAKVLDAGTTDSGRPYFVMELVKGAPITRYCDVNQLTTRQRLQLLLPVCHAIQHAHQKGIIHRDIKPSNVMIAEWDGVAVPKVIDFGVAKAIRSNISEQTVFTQHGQVIGTVDYMSPEQATLNSEDIDTRSDIYSLGVLLYELLTGTTPFEKSRLYSAAWDELLRIIREEDPPKPSTRVSSLNHSSPLIAANRQTEFAKLSDLLRGELDWIVMKSIEKDRSRRYATAIGLANDIQRYLSDQPVSACPPSASYRFQKFTRRNRALMLSLTAGILLLAISAIVNGFAARSSWISAQDAALERDRAKQGYQQAEQQRQRAVRAEQAALERLFESKIAFTQASVVSRRQGQQLKSLQALSEAAELMNELPQLRDRRLLLRNLMIAALATPDVGEATLIERLQRSEQHTSLSPDFRRIAFIDFKPKMQLVVRALEGLTKSDLRLPIEILGDRNYRLQFDGSGRYLAANSLDEAIVWDLHDHRLAVRVSPCIFDSVSFSANGKFVSIVERGRGVHVYQLPEGELLQTIEDPGLLSSAITPDGSGIWVERGGRGPVDRIAVGDTQGETNYPLPIKAGPSFVTTSYDEQLMAISQFSTIVVFVCESGAALPQLRGHDSYACQLQFHASDPIHLVSASWDGTIKLWNVATGDCLLTLFARTPQLSEDGTKIAFHRGMDVAVADFVAASACRWLRGVPCFATTISKDGKWLAAGFGDGFGIWNLTTLQPAIWITTDPVFDVDFDPQTGDLWTCQDRGVFAWSWQGTDAPKKLTASSGRLLDRRLDRPVRQLSSTADGKKLIVDCHHSDLALVVNRDDHQSEPIKLSCRFQMNVTISPQGDFAALGTSHASDVHVFDLATREKIRQLPASGWSTPRFSPDGKQLFAGGRTTLTNWSTDDWRAAYEMPANVSSGGALIAFSKQADMGAVFVDSGALKLIRLTDATELCTLTPPTSLTQVNALCFSPDDRILSVSCGVRGLCIWDLETIRDRLTALGLQWQSSNEAPTPETSSDKSSTQTATAD